MFFKHYGDGNHGKRHSSDFPRASIRVSAQASRQAQEFAQNHSRLRRRSSLAIHQGDDVTRQIVSFCHTDPRFASSIALVPRASRGRNVIRGLPTSPDSSNSIFRRRRRYPLEATPRATAAARASPSDALARVTRTRASRPRHEGILFARTLARRISLRRTGAVPLCINAFAETDSRIF